MVSSMSERNVAEEAGAEDAIGKDDVKTSAASRRQGRNGPRSSDDGHVSQVLRTVYQRTVEEDIPPEMLDLLSKLD